MRIAIDGLPLTQPLTGVGHYTAELARHLALSNPEDQINVVSPRRFLTKPEGPENLRCFCPTINPLRRAWWRKNLATYLSQNSIDVFHGTNYELPPQANCATVVTIHDLSTLLHPEFHEKRIVERAREQLPNAATNATLVVTPTESIRGEVHEQLNVPLDKVFAVAESARECFRPANFDETATLRNRLGIGNKFVLYVGTIEPRKNLLNLVQAFEEISAEYKDVKLVVTGRKGWLVDGFYEYIKSSNKRDRIVLTGYLHDEELRLLYSSCTIFVYPSLYEGFGLPPLEAMACGAAVLSSRIASIKEVVADGARLISTDMQSIATAIRELLSNIGARNALAESGSRRATEFSWTQTAKLTREIYGEAIARFRQGN
jgi:glycosyltransferase involved in cell wall biosynthesis